MRTAHKIDIELTRMYVNDQRLYGGWIGKGFSIAPLSTTNGEITGISAAFEWNDRFYTDPDMAPDSEIHGYQPWFDLILLPPGMEVIAYRDPPAGLYETYEKIFLDDYDFYVDHGIGYAGIRYVID